MGPEKIQTVKDFREPHNKKGLQSFLGFIHFNCRYIEKFAHTIEPLIELLKKEKRWKWEEKHGEAFNVTKKTFLKEMIVAFPDFSTPLHLNMDVSNTAISGELYRMVDGKRKRN